MKGVVIIMKRRLKRSIITLAAVLLFLCVLCVLIEIKVLPKALAAAEIQTKASAELLISDTVFNVLEKMKISSDDFVTYEISGDNKITAIKTNTVLQNKLKSAISRELNERFCGNEKEEIYIPLGTLSGSSLLSGRGPDIKIRYTSLGSAATDIESSFVSAGLNQTKHMIIIKVNVCLIALVPFGSVNVDIYTSVTVAETVIVGNVPSYIFGKAANN